MNDQSINQTSYPVNFSDKVDPETVPYRRTYRGNRIPAIGLGTFGSDRFNADEIASAVLTAVRLGYRHIDCASVYGNQKEIGQSLRIAMDEGIPREDLFITSKLWNDRHDDVQNACRESLADLGLDYLDLYLVHWPFPNHHPPGCDVSTRMADAKPYIHENFMNTWSQMEQLTDLGLVREIGTSNVSIPKLKGIIRDARIKPAVNQMELHPHFQQPELFAYVLENGILPIGYSPVGSPARPDRDRTSTDTVDIEDPSIIKAAERLKVHPAIICVKWARQRGQIPIPFSTNPKHILANIKAIVEDPLTEAEMSAISKADRNCRLIKGQVFLWKQNQRWEELWDINGMIIES